MKIEDQFKEVWFVDFEFHPVSGQEGDLCDPVCLVAHEYFSGKTIRLFREEFGPLPPYPTDETSLFVAFYASAEIGCHLVLDWPVPVCILDLYVEFRRATTGRYVGGRGLLDALVYYGLDHIDAHDKKEMRDLVLSRGPWDDEQKLDILNYCETDVTSLVKLLPAMLPKISIPLALLCGRYMAAVARMEHTGVPIDVEALQLINEGKDRIKLELISRVDNDFGVYDGGSFRSKQFAEYLVRNNIPWHHHSTGQLKLDEDTFRQAAKSYPVIEPLHQLRCHLSENRSKPLAVGNDDRNRCMLSPFSSSTGRNQPSTARAIFHRPAWNRSLIKPAEGYGISYIDYCQQEVGVAAALSGDKALQHAYTSGDPYLEFGKQAGAIPLDGTKKTHGELRDKFKACVLGVQFGMEAESLGRSANCSILEARELLRLHRETYSVFWKWSQGNIDRVMLGEELLSAFGWPCRYGSGNPRSIGNFLMQANGAEILRLACCMVTEEGIQVCAPVHDAVLIEAPLPILEATICRVQDIMREASRIVLGGFELRADAETIVRYPDRYVDKRGKAMWDTMMELLMADKP